MFLHYFIRLFFENPEIRTPFGECLPSVATEFPPFVDAFHIGKGEFPLLCYTRW